MHGTETCGCQRGGGRCQDSSAGCGAPLSVVIMPWCSPVSMTATTKSYPHGLAWYMGHPSATVLGFLSKRAGLIPAQIHELIRATTEITLRILRARGPEPSAKSPEQQQSGTRAATCCPDWAGRSSRGGCSCEHAFPRHPGTYEAWVRGWPVAPLQATHHKLGCVPQVCQCPTCEHKDRMWPGRPQPGEAQSHTISL